METAGATRGDEGDDVLKNVQKLQKLAADAADWRIFLCFDFGPEPCGSFSNHRHATLKANGMARLPKIP